MFLPFPGFIFPIKGPADCPASGKALLEPPLQERLLIQWNMNIIGEADSTAREEANGKSRDAGSV